MSESAPPLPDRTGGAPAFSRLARMETLILLAMIVGAILRFARLGDVPPGLNQDEAVSGYDAYSLLLTGRDHLGHPATLAGLESFGDWVSPMLTFLTIPAVALFGLKVETLRGVSAAVGVLAVPLIAGLAVELFGRRALGVVAAWLIAISPWHVHQSRWAIPPVMVPTMVIATLLAFVWAIKRLSGRGLVIAGVVAGLTVASYPTMKLYVPLLLLAVAIVYWRALLRFRRADLAYAALAFLLITWSIYYLSLRDPGGRARLEIVSVFRNRSQAVGAGLLLKQYLSYFSTDFLFVKGDGDMMHTPAGFGVETRALAPLLLIGLLCLGYAVALPELRRR
jgi:4-amino-4-deoxy-L-arabinose transferase-like glycosyltransferase